MSRTPRVSKRRVPPNTVAWEDIPKPPDLEERVSAKILELNLRAVREQAGLSQEELAASMEMAQSDLSKFERRADHLVSRLRLFVEALGGRLEIIAVVKGKRINLTRI